MKSTWFGISGRIFLLVTLGVGIPVICISALQYRKKIEVLHQRAGLQLQSLLAATVGAAEAPLWNFSAKDFEPSATNLLSNPMVKGIRVSQEDGTVFFEQGQQLTLSKLSQDVKKGQRRIGSVELFYSLDQQDQLERSELINQAVYGIALSFFCAILCFVFLRQTLVRKIKNTVAEIALLELGSSDLAPITVRDEVDGLRLAFRNSAQMLAGLVLQLEDKTREQEDIIRARSAQIVESAKMSSLGEMAGSIAHEINNPLAIILGKNAMIEKRLTKAGTMTPELQKDLQVIAATVERAVKVVRGLRQFSRTGDGDLMDVESLDKIVTDTVALCSEKFKAHGVLLNISCADGLSLRCRPVQLSQVILNLLNNSFDAICELEEKWVSIKTQKNGSSVEILITDSGKGISASVAEKLMQPFFTTKAAGKGTGLGLSISKGIIEAHGGEMRLNRESSNTQFVIRFDELKNSKAA